MVKFTNEEAVTQAIVANAPTPGVYFMPYVPQNANGMNTAEFDAAEQTAMEKLQNGPFVFASVRLGAMGPFPKYIGTKLGAQALRSPAMSMS